MTASQPSKPLLRAGRSSVRSCVEAGELEEVGLAADAQSAFDRLAGEVMVLPVASLYLTLRERGRSE